MRWSENEYNEYLKRIDKFIPSIKPKKHSKYHAEKTWVDGICFDSKKEADYYSQLRLLSHTGKIKGFCRQCRFIVTEGQGASRRATEYVADFVVFNNDGTCRIIDTKGVITNEFKLKMKSFQEKYPQLTVELE